MYLNYIYATKMYTESKIMGLPTTTMNMMMVPMMRTMIVNTPDSFHFFMEPNFARSASFYFSIFPFGL